MQHDGSGLKLPCKRTFKIKTSQIIDFDQADKAQTTVQSQRIDSASNRLLGFTQSITTTKGTKTLATTSAQVNYALDALGNMATDGLRDFSYDAANRHHLTSITKDGEAAKSPTCTTPKANASLNPSHKPPKPYQAKSA